MWETLEFCIDVVDSHSLELLVPRLAQLVKSGIGLNTRYIGKYLSCHYSTSGLPNLIALNSFVPEMLFWTFGGCLRYCLHKFSNSMGNICK